MFTSILLLVSAVIIALIIYTMTMEKLRHIAMLKLIGAPDRTIIGMIVQQALALGMTGFVFGALSSPTSRSSSRAAWCWTPTTFWRWVASWFWSACWRAPLACARR